MSARYRITYFVPDPFLDERTAIGAMVEDAGAISWVVARRLPDVSALGDAATAGLMAALIRRLELHPDLNPAPGPQLEFGEIQTLPEAVGRPEEWLQLHLLPAPAGAAIKAGA